MLPDRVSNPGPLTYESGALPIALRGPARNRTDVTLNHNVKYLYLGTIQGGLYFLIITTTSFVKCSSAPDKMG